MICICVKCGHQWMNRKLTDKPKACPKCKSYNWDFNDQVEELKKNER